MMGTSKIDFASIRYATCLLTPIPGESLCPACHPEKVNSIGSHEPG